MTYPQVRIVEEVMREGMQIEDPAIPVADKIRLLQALSETGLEHIVVGSFVSPRWTPQMANIDELLHGFEPRPGVRYTALVLNSTGAERARAHADKLDLAVDLPRTLVHMCDVFVRRNANRTQADEMNAWPAIVAQARAAGATTSGIGLNAAWGSNWVGGFSLEQRMTMLQRQHDLWESNGIEVIELALGDPMGWNMPDAVAQQLRAVRERWPSIRRFHLHLHNQRGTAPISTYAALRELDEEYELILDTTLGGIGGCPYCGNGQATGMMPTEDLVDLLEELGIDTGVDLPRLIDAVHLLEATIGRQTPSHVAHAGPRPHQAADLYAMDMPMVQSFDEALHFRRGPAAYANAPSPWKGPIESEQRDAALSTLEVEVQR